MNNYLLIKNKDNKAYAIDIDGKDVLLGNSIIKYFEDRCIEHLSTYEGRIKACKKTLNISQKAPLLISELTMELWFPALSDKKKENIWINYNEVLDFMSKSSYETLIIFKSGYKYIVPFNYRIIKNQMDRCKRLLERLISDN